MRYLFILLIAWTISNDAWAEVTSEPCDDAIASEDDVYLNEGPETVTSRPPGCTAPRLSRASARVAFLTRSNSRAGRGLDHDIYFEPRPLLYLIMTLRR
jgi:hypothetical protein